MALISRIIFGPPRTDQPYVLDHAAIQRDVEEQRRMLELARRIRRLRRHIAEQEAQEHP